MSNATQASIATAVGGAFTLGFINYVPDGNPWMFVAGLATVAAVRIVIDIVKEVRP